MVCTDPLGFEVQFVTSIPVSGAPITGTLNLVNDGWCTLKDTRFPPPEKRRAEVSNLLWDGARYPADAYDNRVIELRLSCEVDDTDILATEIQKLIKELDKPFNTLLIRPSTTEEIYFRTFGVSPSEIEIITRKKNIARIAVDIPAEPFGFGRPETLNVLVANDPASGAPNNPTYVDIAGIRGDVPAATIIYDNGEFFNVPGTIAIRRRGNPSNVLHVIQAEDMIQGTDTTTQPHDSNFSGTGNNYSRCTFGTDATLIRRLGYFLPDSVSTDHRGTYRIFVRCRRTSGIGIINMQAFAVPGNGAVGGGPITVSKVATLSNALFQTVDLGLLQVPYGIDNMYLGPSGSEIPVFTDAVWLQIHVERESGSASLDIDFIRLMPADDQLMMVDVGNETLHGINFDSYADMGYAYDIFDGSTDSTTKVMPIGAIPELKPGVTNRLYFIVGNLIAGTSEFDFTWYPRYLFIRPETT